MFKSKENKKKINFRSVYKTETINISFDYDFIDIKKYEKQKLIHISDDYKMYKIINKDNQKIYFAKKIINNEHQMVFSSFTKEINHYLSFDNHPSFFKFIGCSPFDFKNKQQPIYITEFGSNGSLEKVLNLDIKNPSNLILNYTKRLIILYGIASGMSYLHSQNIIHCDLNPSKIILDEFLFPKIIGFGNSQKLSKHPIPDVSQLRIEYIYFDNNIYNPPEFELYDKRCSAGDVYSFSFVVYEILTSEVPFENIKDQKQFFNEIVNKISRPSLNKVSKRYKELISSCWSQNPRERPDFTSIVRELKTDKNFITDKIIEKEFRKFIEIIEHCD